MFFDGGCAACGDRPGPVCESCTAALRTIGPVVVDCLDGCHGAFLLDDTSRPLIAALKYRNRRQLAAWFADAMAPAVPRGADVITWIPATPEKRRLRGYDQSRELARALSARTGVPAIGLLRRHRADSRQTGQARHARMRGPSLNPRRRSPPFVVLVDDVVTTGSSLRVGAEVLRAYGGLRIVGVVAAATPLVRTPPLPTRANTSRIPTWK